MRSICQVSLGVPVAEFISDLPHLIDGNPWIGTTEYLCSCENNDRLRGLLVDVTNRTTTADR
jgi:hypothetical protein